MDQTSDTRELVDYDPAEGSHVEDGVVEHPTAEDFGHARTLPQDRTGLTEQLDYVKWLGVDCLWLPPFYGSPLRDGGYDIPAQRPRSSDEPSV